MNPSQLKEYVDQTYRNGVKQGLIGEGNLDRYVVGLQIPALFIPLKSEFYEAFIDGSKTKEFRVYGPRWNERTCPVGRRVTISKGYGIKHRASGLIVSFEVSEEPTKSEAWRKCYGEKTGALAACIEIRLDPRRAAS